ncbi:MAG: hypothetical protein ACYC5A_07155 [Thermoleophilia bacterium]
MTHCGTNRKRCGGKWIILLLLVAAVAVMTGCRQYRERFFAGEA